MAVAGGFSAKTWRAIYNRQRVKTNLPNQRCLNGTDSAGTVIAEHSKTRSSAIAHGGFNLLEGRTGRTGSGAQA